MGFKKRNNNKKKQAQIPSAQPISMKLTPPCHEGPIEIIPNLFLGSYPERKKMVFLGVDVLIPLDSLDGDIWNMGFRGEIYYCPIEDYGILPIDVATTLVGKIRVYLAEGKKVGLFCIGGHGRTGYVAALVLGAIGYEDPIAHLRTEYCKKAIETQEQIKGIATFLGDPSLLYHEATAFSCKYASDPYLWEIDFFPNYRMS